MIQNLNCNAHIINSYFNTELVVRVLMSNLQQQEEHFQPGFEGHVR
jgi:hypothetical protein